MYLVDMPGYGFAEGNKAKIQAWNDLIIYYLTHRNSLMRVFVLLDARRGITEIDDELLQMLTKIGVSHQIVLTKCDLLVEKDNHAKLVQKMQQIYQELETNAKYSMCYPVIIPTSSETGDGIDELLGNILLASGLIERMVLVPQEKKLEMAQKETQAYKLIQEQAKRKAEAEDTHVVKKKKSKKVEKQVKKQQLSEQQQQQSGADASQQNQLPAGKKSIILGLDEF